MSPKRRELPPKPSIARLQESWRRRRWDYVPPEPPPAPQGPPLPPEYKRANLPDSAGDAWGKSVGLPPAAGRASDTAAPAERYQPSSSDAPIPGTGAASGRQDSFLDDIRKQLYEIGYEGGGFQNRPTERDILRDRQAAANRERILKLFRETPYAGELLANGKIWWDNRHLWPEDWEREFFRGTS
jgi:hypothetical protein